MSIGFPAYHIQRLNLRDTNLRAVVSAALVQTSWTVLETTKHSMCAEIGLNIWSFGETIQITFIDDETIEIHSKSRLLTQIFDWGKNKKNVDTLVNLIIEQGAANSVAAVSSEAPSVQDSELQNLEKKKSLLRKKLRGKRKLKQARKYERQLDYEQALDLYRELDRVEDIRRINKEKQGAGVAGTTIVHGTYIDDRDKYTTNIDDRDTIIKDSVLNRSNIGGDKSKAEELRDAKALLDDGIIDAAEFKQMKKEFLGK